jgi:hypothetical protein
MPEVNMLEVIEKKAFHTRRRKPNCSRIVSNTQPMWRFCNALEFGLQPVDKTAHGPQPHSRGLSGVSGRGR